MRTARAVALALVAVFAGGAAARAEKDPHAEAQKLIKKLARD